MRYCGVDFKGSETLLAIIDADETQYNHIQVKTRKIKLEDPFSNEGVRNVKRLIEAFIIEHAIERVVLKKRALKGDYAGGPISFKFETIFQLLDGVDVRFISPQSIASTLKNYDYSMPEVILGYQKSAFQTALAHWINTND